MPGLLGRHGVQRHSVPLRDPRAHGCRFLCEGGDILRRHRNEARTARQHDGKQVVVEIEQPGAGQLRAEGDAGNDITDPSALALHLGDLDIRGGRETGAVAVGHEHGPGAGVQVLYRAPAHRDELSRLRDIEQRDRQVRGSRGERNAQFPLIAGDRRGRRETRFEAGRHHLAGRPDDAAPAEHPEADDRAVGVGRNGAEVVLHRFERAPLRDAGQPAQFRLRRRRREGLVVDRRRAEQDSQHQDGGRGAGQRDDVAAVLGRHVVRY